MSIARLARTVVHLRPVQLYGRLLFRLRKPRFDPAPAPPRRALSGWQPPVSKRHALTGRTSVSFLNVAGEIADADGWNDPARDKLWLYNLHYFDELSAPSGEDRAAWRRELVARWIAENPPGRGNGWEPYPISLRIVNWIKWALAGEQMEPAWLDSLAAQTRWLMQRIEWHLLANHLFTNAKALVFAGLFFSGPEADKWLATGLRILDREVPEQILADGGHFELSPMYHAIILEDLLDLVNLAAAAGLDEGGHCARWREVSARMGDWLAAMTHPDGEIAFFNDAAINIAPSPVRVATYAERLGVRPARAPGEGVTHLRESGYVRLQRGDAVALLDLAAVGPSYIPGHAHADSLSFELSLGAQRVIVNGGTSTYAGDSRAFERSTAAHSTVVVAEQDSSEVWSSFRVGRRAHTRIAETADGDGVALVSGSHDGYRFLPGRPRHRRSWRLEAGRFTIEDRIEGGGAPAVAYFHLHPGVAVDGETLNLPDRQIRITGSGPLRVVPSRWACGFGRVEPSLVLAADVTPGGLVVQLDW